MQDTYNLSTADYIIFALLLVISSFIGLYFRIFAGQQKTNEEYLLAGRNMAIIPVSFSLMATFLTSSNLLGIPAEIYLYGTHMIFMNVGFILAPIITAFVFLPIYYEKRVSTPYEYLEKRFGKTTRKFASALFLIENTLFNGVTLYGCALALSPALNISIWTLILILGLVCTFYSSIGGIKAVLWTDVFHALMMYTCIFVVVIKGCIDHGGLYNIFRIAKEGGRIVVPTFHVDFSRRYTIWSIVLQGMIITCRAYSASHLQVQRMITIKKLKNSKIATIISGPMISVFQLMCCLCGLIFFVQFKSCDPITSPQSAINSADQLLPYYVVSTIGQYTGLPGICIAGIVSASLSSISSSITAMTAATFEDFIRPTSWRLSKSVLFTKCICVFYGCLATVVTYLVSSLGNIIQTVILITGLSAGPKLGVFILAVFTNTANEWGANIGIATSFLISACMAFIPKYKQYEHLPVGHNCSEAFGNTSFFQKYNPSCCNNTMMSMANFQETTTIPSENMADSENFSLSFMWITPFSLLFCIVLGYTASCLISYFRQHSLFTNPIMQRRWKGYVSRSCSDPTANKLPEGISFTDSMVSMKYELTDKKTLKEYRSPNEEQLFS